MLVYILYLFHLHLTVWTALKCWETIIFMQLPLKIQNWLFNVIGFWKNSHFRLLAMLGSSSGESSATAKSCSSLASTVSQETQIRNRRFGQLLSSCWRSGMDRERFMLTADMQTGVFPPCLWRCSMETNLEKSKNIACQMCSYCRAPGCTINGCICDQKYESASYIFNEIATGININVHIMIQKTTAEQLREAWQCRCCKRRTDLQYTCGRMTKRTQPVKSLWTVWFLMFFFKKVSFAHKDCIYLIQSQAF